MQARCQKITFCCYYYLLILYFKCFLWPLSFTACDEGPGLCAHLITFLSILLVFVTIPFSLCFAVKVVQEYERVVIFRLGRLLSGGARGPGIFFVVPCVDSYQKVDMRTLTFDVPPQEVKYFKRSWRSQRASSFDFFLLLLLLHFCKIPLNLHSKHFS